VRKVSSSPCDDEHATIATRNPVAGTTQIRLAALLLISHPLDLRPMRALAATTLQAARLTAQCTPWTRAHPGRARCSNG
jgi:hypothetical protein